MTRIMRALFLLAIAAFTFTGRGLPGVSADYDPTVNGYGHGSQASVGVSSKRIIFPKGAVLTIKPTLEIPLLDDSEFHWKTFSSNFMFEMPIKINLDKLGKYALSKWMYLGQHMLENINMSELPDGNGNGLGFTYLNSAFNSRSSKKGIAVATNQHSFNQTYPTQMHSPYVYTYKSSARARTRARRAINPTRRRQQQQRRYDDRFHVLTKLENVLDSVGWSPGQGCLLRAICELHEYFTTAPGQGYNFEGYGLVGEVALLLLSVSKTSAVTQKALQQHLEAERAGVAGNCSKYFRVCSKSVFQQ